MLFMLLEASQDGCDIVSNMPILLVNVDIQLLYDFALVHELRKSLSQATFTLSLNALQHERAA